MQQYAGFYYCKLTLHVSGVYRPHHQEYMKLTTASGTGHITYQGNDFLPACPNKATLAEGHCPDT